MKLTPRLPLTITLASLVVGLAARHAAAEPLFASPPHVVADGGRQRIVLFLNEPVNGALAAQDGGSFEVRVPRSRVDPAIQGQDFGADGWGDSGEAVRHLVLASGPQGDTRIRIEPAGAVGGLDAQTADDPPRLVIDLLASGPAPAPSRAPKPQPTKGAPRASATATPRPTATARPSLKPASSPRPTATVAVSGRSTLPGTSEPVAIAAAPAADAASPDATVLTASAPLAAAASAAPRPTTTPASAAFHEFAPARPASVAGAGRPGAAASPAAPPGDDPAPAALGCIWHRVGGVAMCSAEPSAPPYVGDPALVKMATALAHGEVPPPEERPATGSAAFAYLIADRAFAARAPDGKLLPVVDAYRRALRAHPDFAEAWRARLNIALAYRALEFRAELKVVAREAAFDPTAGLVRGLSGDLAALADQASAADEEYRSAAAAGGLGTCFAARGRARLALAADDPARAEHELATLGILCPREIADDPETAWVRARLAIAYRDWAGARKILTEIQPALAPTEQGAVIADLGAVAEAAGDAATARRHYEQLVGGTYGPRATRQGTVRLAILDGAGGDVPAGLKRLDRLTPEASDPARRTLVMQAARRALERGAAAEAVAALHEAHVDPTGLPLEEQLVVAEAYRDVGLADQAQQVLDAARASAGAASSDALFAARAAIALDRRDAAGALAIADEWLRARGRNGGALAVRARAAALAGDGIGAHAAVAAAVMEDPSLARTLPLTAAEALRDREPTAALALARQAVASGDAPELPAERAAAAWALVGALAEGVGDDDTALAAFTTLSARYGNQPAAADAAYRAARLAARRAPGNAAGAYEDATRSKDVLARRVAGAAREYEAIVRPLGGPAERP